MAIKTTKLEFNRGKYKLLDLNLKFRYTRFLQLSHSLGIRLYCNRMVVSQLALHSKFISDACEQRLQPPPSGTPVNSYYHCLHVCVTDRYTTNQYTFTQGRKWQLVFKLQAS